MTTDAQRTDFEKQFSQLLELFDKETKPELSKKLRKFFQLDEDEKFSFQMERKLQRKLTANERFKLNILETAFEYHGGDEESEDDSEEEEEEEE